MKRIRHPILVASVGIVLSSAFFITPAAQTPDRTASNRIPRTADRKPDFNGVWQVLNTAAWDIQDHGPALGVPPGPGVVDGNELPYQPWALERKKENFANRTTADLAEANCYMPGVPRASLVVIAATLASFNIPEAGLLLIIGIDQFLDMGRSATNVLGNTLATAVVAKWEGEKLHEVAPEAALKPQVA